MTTATWFMKRHWTQENGNLKTRVELSGPDTGQAEQWLAPDLFLFKAKPGRVLFNGKVISGNGEGTQERLFN